TQRERGRDPEAGAGRGGLLPEVPRPRKRCRVELQGEVAEGCTPDTGVNRAVPDTGARAGETRSLTRAPVLSSPRGGKRMGLLSEVARPYRCCLFIGFFLILCAVPACRTIDVPLWAAATPPEERAFEVVCLQGVPYCVGPEADAERHRLDLFLPRGRAGYPVL